MTDPTDDLVDPELLDHVSNILHAWSCPLCPLDGAAMIASGQAHVTESDRMLAGFLIAALGLERKSDTPSDPDPTTP